MFKDTVDLALGDSEFNRRELAEAGYPRTGVLPLLLDFAKFEVPGDPVVRSIFAEPKTTILYVGRVIPNKKFEDVIRTFHLYKRELNRNARLVLAGDFRGMERYLAALHDLVDRLAVDDVHLTGHVEFEELVAYFRMADVYLSMSEHEGFGVPLIEAMAAGVTVLAFGCAAIHCADRSLLSQT